MEGSTPLRPSLRSSSLQEFLSVYFVTSVVEFCLFPDLSSVFFRKKRQIPSRGDVTPLPGRNVTSTRGRNGSPQENGTPQPTFGFFLFFFFLRFLDFEMPKYSWVSNVILYANG